MKSLLLKMRRLPPFFVLFWLTPAARNVHRSGCSLCDVELLAGHRSIETTERYIDGDTCLPQAAPVVGAFIGRAAMSAREAPMEQR